MSLPDLTTRSCPTLTAARHFGIPTEYAFLIGDMVLQAVCPGRSVWPEDHQWHIWACGCAEIVAGKHPVRRFVLAMADLYAERWPAEVRAA